RTLRPPRPTLFPYTTLFRSARLALLERRVARLDGFSKADVRERVLVPAIHLRLVGQRAQLLQRRVHLLGGAFEEPPAAAREQRIATEQRPCPIIGDVRARMPGDVDHREI